MAATTIRKRGGAPSAQELQRAHQIVVYAHESAESLLAGYNSLGQARGPGAPSDAQQDLLRAMLLFAGAGLDACAQQAVRDGLPRLAAEHEDARKALVGFAASRLRRQGDTDAAGINAKFLAEVLIGHPEGNLIDALVDELTGSSMQSVEELKRVAAYLGLIGNKPLMNAIQDVQDAFAARNRIAHDMDIKFTTGRGRNRKLRKRADMVRDANRLLAAAEALVAAADSAL